MTPDMKVLYKDFFPEDLEPLIKQKNITKTVIVQAADTVAETEFTLSLASKYEFIAGVVGWVDLDSNNAKDDIDKLCESKFLKGFRPMIHDIQDDAWMLNDHLKENIKYLNTKNLTFDALVRPNHLQHLIQFVKKYDFLPIVIDHIAKPVITKSEIDQWKKDMTELSNASNVYCKFSGILTEVGPDYTKEQLDPYIDFILNTFGSDKLMWGSDWPVLTMADNYLIAPDPKDWLSRSNRLQDLEDCFSASYPLLEKYCINDTNLKAWIINSIICECLTIDSSISEPLPVMNTLVLSVKK